MAKKSGENKKPLLIENTNITTITGVAKVSNVIHLYNMYSWSISNANINITRDSKLTVIEEYQKCTIQIKDK